MRLLFAIVHYYKAGNGRHGSLAANPKPRVDALRQLIFQLHRLYGQPAGLLNHRKRRVDGVDDGGGVRLTCAYASVVDCPRARSAERL